MQAGSGIFRGWYFDGRSAARETVLVWRCEDGIAFADDGQSTSVWPAGSWRAAVHPSLASVRIERLPYSGESLIVEDERFAASMVTGPSINAAIYERGTLALVVLAVMAALAAAAVWWSYPFVAQRLADSLPVAVEERWGAAVAASIAPPSQRVESSTLKAASEALIGRLRPTPSPYTWHIAIVNDPMVNAWAAPGGHIAIYSGLVCALQNPDQLAAVAGHEMTHVIERHSTRNLIRTLGVRLGIALLFGGGDHLLDAAAMLGALRYMRSDENSADRGAMRLLVRSHIDPTALAAAFEHIQKHAPELPGALQYVSTHPTLAERRAIAAEEAHRRRGALNSWMPALNTREWQAIRKACGCSND
jgi:predicted Zn-dependent protease